MPNPTHPSRRQAVLPAWTWTELQDLLLGMAATPAQEIMVEHLVEGLRKSAPFLSPAGLLREVAIITLALTDPAFASPRGSRPEAPSPSPPSC